MLIRRITKPPSAEKFRFSLVHLIAITAVISVCLAAEVQLERYLFGKVNGLFFAAAVSPIFWGVLGWLIFHRNVGVILFLLASLASATMIDFQICFHSRWAPVSIEEAIEETYGDETSRVTSVR